MSDSSNSVTKACAVCQSKGPLKACSNCYNSWYCSREHQIQHWRHHRIQCSKHGEVKVHDLSTGLAELEVTRTPSRLVSAAESGEHDDPSDHVADAHTVDRKLPCDLPPHITNQWLIKVANDVVSCLHKFGFAVINKFLDMELGEKILNEAKSLHDRHLMTDGQTIMPSTSESDAPSRIKYRMDKISWVNGVEPDCQTIGTLVTLIDSIMQHARQKLPQYNIQGRTKAMVACYPGQGAGYVRHVDNPAQDGRLLTCIYYLNKNWDCKKDGGVLKIYPGEASRIACVAPIMDRLIVFWSDKRNPHEVMPAYRTRFAVTTWYFDAKERAEAIKKVVSRKSNGTKGCGT